MNRLQKLFAWLAAGISILAATAFTVVGIGMLFLEVGRDELATGFWSALLLIVWLGFTCAVALIIAYIATSWLKNSRSRHTSELS